MARMRDSGIKWIGEIPENWNVKKVKYLAKENDSLFIDGDWIESDVITEEGIRYLTTGNVGAGYYKEQGCGYISTETFEKMKCLKVIPGDLMISRLNEPIGRACIVPDTEEMYVVAVDNVILRPDKNYDKKFIMYCMNTNGYADNGKEAARGSTMQRISRGILGTFYIPVTSLKEQQLIASFLDDKVEKIEGILDDLNNQIQILNKYKRSLITEVVTKGLNSNLKMKNSELEWIGEIPENWTISKLKYVSDFVNGDRGANYPSGDDMVDEGVIFVTSNNIHGFELDHSPEISKYITVERYELLRGAKLEIDDIIFCLRGSVGMCAINKTEKLGTIASSLVDIKPRKINANFLNYFLQSEISTHQTNIYMNGSCAANLSAENVSNYYFIEPSLEEQQEISDYLNNKCAKIEELIKDKQKQIEQIEKYKKSLIYEYVTGKKRVKGAEEVYG